MITLLIDLYREVGRLEGYLFVSRKAAHVDDYYQQPVRGGGGGKVGEKKGT